MGFVVQHGNREKNFNKLSNAKRFAAEKLAAGQEVAIDQTTRTSQRPIFMGGFRDKRLNFGRLGVKASAKKRKKRSPRSMFSLNF